MNWAFVALGICAALLGVERAVRQRGEPVTLTQRCIIISLFAIGVGAVAYGTTGLTAPFDNIGRVIWHCAAAILVGALEILIVTLRSEQVSTRTVRHILARSGTVLALLLIAWPLGTAYEPTIGVDRLSDHTFSTAVTLIVFPAHVIRALTQVVFLSIFRIPRDIMRRPISTIALLLIAVGCTGFIWINAMTALYMNTGRITESGGPLALSPLCLAVSVAGAVMLAVGERLYDEISARYQLRQLTPLWQRMIELSDQDLHLSVQNFPAPSRLQRAYVEIADAICTLRIVVDGPYDPESVTSALRRGDVTEDPTRPTLSRALPPRQTRREDLQLIMVLANTYRRTARERGRLPALRA